ncbi:MAG: hypothetical protein OEZ39_16675 [Gammaproteobacteria bacterium]|nr:hypothetical protein [Gammaproteobacteria bacterium]MDH5653495.1 hypothetical protein [Gammaproteobacteria bacterium]
MHFYHIGLPGILRWWLFNFTKAEGAGFIFFSLIFSWMLFIPLTAGILSTGYLALFGEEQELVYLGHKDKSLGTYYDLHDKNRTIISGYDVDNTYNLSFEPIYRINYFAKDRGHDNQVGEKENRFTLYYFTGTLMFILAFGVFSMGSAHAMAYQPYKAKFGDSGDLQGDGNESFDMILTKLHLGKGHLVVMVFGGLILGVVFQANVPDERVGPKVNTIPSVIKEGYTTSAIPVAFNKHYKTVRRSNSSGSSSSETVDTGYRFASFMFTKQFDLPVYVSYRFHIDEFPELANQIQHNIAMHREMTIVIGRDLRIGRISDR